MTKPLILTYPDTLSHLHRLGRDGSSRLAEFVEAVVVKNCLDMLVGAKAIDVIEDGGEEWINLTEQFDDELKLDQVTQRLQHVSVISQLFIEIPLRCKFKLFIQVVIPSEERHRVMGSLDLCRLCFIFIYELFF